MKKKTENKGVFIGERAVALTFEDKETHTKTFVNVNKVHLVNVIPQKDNLFTIEVYTSNKMFRTENLSQKSVDDITKTLYGESCTFNKLGEGE